MAKTKKVNVTNVTEDDKNIASEYMNQELKAELTDFIKMSKSLKTSLVDVSVNDIRFLVQAYYQMQEMRIILGGRVRAIEQGKSYGANVVGEDGVPHAEVLRWLYLNMLGLENEVKKALDIWSSANPIAAWCKQVIGIGPVISAGLVAQFDITRAPSVSHFMSYAGLNNNNDPWLGKEKATKLVNKYCSNAKVTMDELELISSDEECSRSLEKLVNYAREKDKKGNFTGKLTKAALIKGLSKPPYNEDLKILCWKLSESFVKVSGNPNSLYGRIYRERKQYEIKKNEAGEYTEYATKILTSKNWKDKKSDTYQAYLSGKLPDSHITARAKRYAMKLFISHLWEEMYRQYYNAPAPRPYAIAELEHVDYIAPEVPFIPLDSDKPSSYPENPVRYYGLFQ